MVKGKLKKEGKHSGYEYRIAETVVKSLNMKLEVSLPPDGVYWGRTYPDGTSDGKLNVTFFSIKKSQLQGYQVTTWQH